LSQAAWAKANRKAAPVYSAEIVKKQTVPRRSAESPERKKRAAPSPERIPTPENDEASMTSSAAGELANEVLTQIQEASSEAKAPSGPRTDA
jgi:hypothetical protein